MDHRTRILIMTPTAWPSVTGNAVTTERWKRSLEKKGFSVEVLPAEGLRPQAMIEALDRFSPDLLHVYHIFRSGRLILDPLVFPRCTRLPLVVSPGGTDVNIDIQFADRKEIVLRICRMARAIVVQSAETAGRLERFIPDLRAPLVHIPKAFTWMGRETCDLRTMAGCAPEEILLFLPAGIRPVKGNLECLAALEKLHAVRPRVRVIFAGPAIDPEYAFRFGKEVGRMGSFACWIPLIPPEAIRSAYEASDIVLNASFSEGLSNALLEAVSVGRPILASNVPGNRWPVIGDDGDAPGGLLFDPADPDDFVRQALRLVDDKDVRETLGRAGRERASRWPGPEAEGEGLAKAYEIALRESPDE